MKSALHSCCLRDTRGAFNPFEVGAKFEPDLSGNLKRRRDTPMEDGLALSDKLSLVVVARLSQAR